MEVEDNKFYDERVGTFLYLPPEIMRSRTGKELKAGDIWSVGICAYILLCGKAPFKGKNQTETLHLIGTKPVPWPDDKTKPISKQCKSFINSLLTKVPKSRATAKKALEHAWIVENENNPNHNATSSRLLENVEDFSRAGLFLFFILFFFWLYVLI